MSVPGAIIGGLFNVGTGILNNQWQRSEMDRARLENYRLNERAAENADRRTRQLYEDFYSPEALLRQYEKAGLSPSMMYGGTPGQGGMQGAQGGGGSGLGAMYTPITMVEAAQAAALFAQAKKTSKEAEQVEPLTESEIAKNLADAGHADAAASMLKSQKAGQDLANYITSHTTDASIYQICALAETTAYNAEKTYNEMRSAKVLADVDEATYQQQVDMRIETLNNLISSTAKNKKEVEKIQLDMKQMIYNWDLEYRKLDVQEQQQTSYAAFVNAQIAKMDKDIELKARELGIEETGMWIHAITDMLKDVAIGSMAYAQYRGGGARAAFGAQGAQNMITGKAVKYNKTDRGLRLEKNKNTYPF